MLTTIRQTLHIMGRGQVKRWLFLVVLAIGTSLVEVVAATLIYVLLGLVADPNGSVVLPIVGDIRSATPSIADHTLLIILIAVMIAFFLARAAFTLAAEYVISRTVQKTSARLSVKLVRGYLSLPYSFHLRRNSAELIRNGYQAVTDLVASVFAPMIRIVAESIMTIGVLALLIAVSPLGTALAVGVVGTATLVLLFVVQPRMRKLGSGTYAMYAQVYRTLQHSLHGVRDIKILNRGDYFSDAYGEARNKLARIAYTRDMLSQLPRLVVETALLLFILLFFALTVLRDPGTPGTLSTLGLFAYAGLRLQGSLNRIAGGLNSIKYSTVPAAEIYQDVLAIEKHAKTTNTGEPFAFENDILVKNVSFSYETAESETLRCVDLSIRRGEQIGICGPTGGGKTTLVDIIAGLLSPTAGQVLVDGRDISTNLQGWQRNLGVVPQMVFMIDDTLRRNIALGIADKEIDETALAEAVRLAQLEPFIEALPAGLDTVIGERGVRVSGGERQRLAIARALYARPQVLIFDEGTSALDNLTEQELMSSLERLRGAHTILLVAHRLSTLHGADRVVLIQDGQIAGIDSFEGLRQKNEFFRQMAAAS